MFSKTNSLAIKVRGLQSFVILCGGSNETSPGDDDDLSGLSQDKKKTSSSTALDKYTMQEKIVPLIKVIKTKEPAVMMASLKVLGIVGEIADADFVAMDILPILWSMSLGPLLNLKQFQAFMALIKSLSRRVEDEQTRKLQELGGGSNGATAAPNEDFLAFGGVTGTAFDAGFNGATEDDFEALVKGKVTTNSPSLGSSGGNNGFASWDAPQTNNNPGAAAARSPLHSPQAPPAFAWSSQTSASPAAAASRPSLTQQQQPSYRTVTPDLGRFEPMAPSSTQFSQPLQPTPAAGSLVQPMSGAPQSTPASVSWGTAAAAPNPWASSSTNTMGGGASSNPNYGGSTSMASSMGSLSMGSGQQRPSMSSQTSSFSLPPPPSAGTAVNKPTYGGGLTQSSAPSWANSGTMGGGAGVSNNSVGSMMAQQQQQRSMSGSGTGMMHKNNTSMGAQSKSGLDKYQSLI